MKFVKDLVIETLYEAEKPVKALFNILSSPVDYKSHIFLDKNDRLVNIQGKRGLNVIRFNF